MVVQESNVLQSTQDLLSIWRNIFFRFGLQNEISTYGSFCISWNTVIIQTPNIITDYTSENWYFNLDNEFFDWRLKYNSKNTWI